MLQTAIFQQFHPPTCWCCVKRLNDNQAIKAKPFETSERQQKQEFDSLLLLDAAHVAQLTASKHTHTHPFNGPFSGTTRVGRYQKGKTNLDFTEARDSEWQWHQLGHMHVCTLLQTDNHASPSPLSFLQAGCPSCRPTNSVKALKAITASKH